MKDKSTSITTQALWARLFEAPSLESYFSSSGQTSASLCSDGNLVLCEAGFPVHFGDPIGRLPPPVLSFSSAS